MPLDDTLGYISFPFTLGFETEPPVVHDENYLSVTQYVAEGIIVPTDVGATVSQFVLEGVIVPTPSLDVSQYVVEVIATPPSKLVLSQYLAESIILPTNPKAALTGIFAEVVYSPWPSLSATITGQGNLYSNLTQIFHRSRLGVAVYFNDIDRTDAIRFETLTFSKGLNRMTTCECTLIAKNLSSWVPVEGDRIEIIDTVAEDESYTIFTGYVASFSEDYTRSGSSWLRKFKISGKDATDIFNRHRMVRVFPAQPGGAIIRNLIENLGKFTPDDELGAINQSENIDTSMVEDGPELDGVLTLNLNTALEGIQKICDMTGYTFKMEDRKAIYTANVSNPAPWNITETNKTITGISRKRDIQPYRNVQIIRVANPFGTDTNTHEDTFQCDGIQRYFNCSQYFAEGCVPEVYIDDVRQEIGQLKGGGLGVHQCWYANTGLTIYFFDTPEITVACPPEGSTLRVVYRPNDTSNGLKNYVVVADRDEIAARAAIDGGSGVYMACDEESYLSNEDIATQLAEGRLNLNNFIPTTIDYSTNLSGIEPGMSQSINFMDINSTYYVDTVSGTLTRKSVDGEIRDYLRYKVTASDSERVRRGMDALAKVFEGARIQDMNKISVGGLTDEYAQGIADGANKTFSMTGAVTPGGVDVVTVNGEVIDKSAYTRDGNEITFNTAPPEGSQVRNVYSSTGSTTVPKKSREFQGDSMLHFGNRFHITQDLALNCWIKIPSTADTSNQPTIATKCAFNVGTQYNTMYTWFIVDSGLDGDGKRLFDLAYNHETGTGPTITQKVFTGCNIKADTWTNIGLTRNTQTVNVDGSGMALANTKTVKMYVGNSLVDTYTYTDDPSEGLDEIYSAFTIGGCAKVGEAFAIHPGTELMARIERFYLSTRAWTAKDHQDAASGNAPTDRLQLKLIMGTSPEFDSERQVVGSVIGSNVVVIDSH